MPTAKRFSRATFTAMWADPRQSNKAIAAHFGVRVSWVSITAARLGLSPRKPGIKVIVDATTFSAMWIAGVRTHDMEMHFGFNRNALRAVADRLGLTRRYPGQRCKLKLADVQALLLRDAMTAHAAETAAALHLSEMVDVVRKVAA